MDFEELGPANEFGELTEPNGVNEPGVNYSAGSFIEPYGDQGGYIAVNPEFAPYKNSIMTTGRFHVYYVHPEHGTITFYLKKDDSKKWNAEVKPLFIKPDFIQWIGDKIDNYCC